MSVWKIDSVDSLIFLSFLLINLIIGLYSARGIKTLKEYAVGDGNFSSIVIAATLVATWISGSFFLNTLSEVYSNGLYHLWAKSGNVIFFFIIAYIFAPRMAEFIGNLSIAEAMGNLYGNNVRIVTAIVSCIGAGGFIAAQLNVAGMLIEYGLGIQSFYGVFIAGAIIGIYSALGGIKSVTFTDVIQLITFGTVIPILAFVVFQSLASTDLLIDTLSRNDLFNYKEVFDFSQLKSFNFLLLFLYFCSPSFSPAIFQRVAMAKDTLQLKKSFLIAGGACLFISGTICFIGLFLLSKNSNLDAIELLPYILSNYTYIGVKGLIVAGIMSMVMSTADSFINSTSVILIHDFLKPLTSKSKFISNELLSTKISSVFITLLALTIALIGDKNLLKLIISTQSIYIPMVSVPFVLAVFGFRTSGKSVLIAMFFALISVLVLKFMNYDSIQIMFLAVIISFFFLFSSHYFLKQPGGWVGIKDPSPLFRLKEERKQAKNKFIQDVRNFNLIDFLKKNTSDREYMYIILSFFSFIIVYSMIFTLPKDLAISYESIIRIVYPTMTFTITALLSYPLWPRFMKNSNTIVFVWNFVIFYVLVLGSLFFAIISNFAPIQLILFTTNIILVSMLIRWQLFFIMLLFAVIISIVLTKFYLGRDNLLVNLNYIEFKVSYFLVLIAAIIVTFVKPKQEFGDTLEQKVQERTLDLEKALTAKTEFLNNMSHEIRSPINGFLNISRGLYNNWQTISEEQKIADIKMISDSATRLASLIGNLLDLSKFSRDKMLFNYHQVDLAKIVEEIIDEAKILYLNDKQIRLKFTNSAYDTNILADKERVYQALSNLFINAIKFSSNDSEIEVFVFNAEIEYENENISNGLYLKIKDQGIGIPSNELDEIFNPFMISSFTKTKAGGTGLGLSIVMEIIRGHNGKVWASNNEKGGSSFHILIPNNPQNELNNIINYQVVGRIKQPQMIEIAETEKNDSKKLNILIIDDEEFNIRSLSMIISALGYNIFSSLGGLEGLKLLKENSVKIDIVLLDLMMHDMYGLNVLSEIKSDPNLAHISVILQTGSSDENEITKAYSMGIATCIQKPFTPKIVREAISKILVYSE